MLRESPNLPGWHDYPVRQEIERRLETRVILENDANVAALGEFWLGAGRDYDSLFMFTLGTGVGGGIILDGKIWHGMTGMAGEPGHMTIDPSGPPCACGNNGCLEQFAGANAIVRMAREAVARGEAPALARAVRKPDFGPNIVYQFATRGDETANRIFRVVGEALGTATAGMINALNIPIFVVGGGVAGAWGAFSPYIFEQVRRRSFVYRATAPPSSGAGIAGGVTQITHALLGADSGLYGAARVAMLGARDEAPQEAQAQASR